MYRATEIKQGLLHLLGWRQNYDTVALSIANSLTATESGQYFQDIHPLLTLDNIKAIAPEFKRITIPAHSTSTHYLKGDRVLYSTLYYRSLTNNINKVPIDNPTDWEKYDSFSEWLEQKTGASILNMIQSFYTQKMLDKTTKNILESKVLFDGTGRITDTVVKTNSMVGFEITPLRQIGSSLRIEKIGLQFKGTGNIIIYLFHSSQVDPVTTKTLTRTKDGSVEWFDFGEILTYVEGGTWFLCYDETENSQQAIFKIRDWSAKPCSTCSRSDYYDYLALSRYTEFHPFKTVANDHTLWDITKNVYTYSENYGINLQCTLACDLTDFIISQRLSFQNAIGLQVASDLIREMAYNPNFNISRLSQNMTKMEFLYELDGDITSSKKSGIGYKLDCAMQAIKLDFSALNKSCMPCGKTGVRYTAT